MNFLKMTTNQKKKAGRRASGLILVLACTFGVGAGGFASIPAFAQENVYMSQTALPQPEGTWDPSGKEAAAVGPGGSGPASEGVGIWQQDPTGIDRYYTKSGAMWVNSVTPDGYYVDGTGAWIPSQYEVSSFTTIPSDAKSLMVIEGHGKTARATFYVKQGEEQIQLSQGPGSQPARADGWTKITDTGAYVGRNGIGKEKEGDEKTPRGLFTLDEAFGTKAAPEQVKVPYLQVDDGYYWVGDSSSPYYNQMADIRKTGAVFDTAVSEHLSSYGGKAYYYCLAVGFNKEQTPNKGSAIFLHCTDGPGTGGCIAIPEAAMEKVLKNLVYPAYILIDEGENLKNY
ncbi:MAG: L,D-transpeptidase family protein [Lachnospiraceae bacterium]|nr:L,D-transpeptidase family protein [Lachnospiraceae bacterium]